MTNLIATVSIVIATNWVTVSRTVPVCNMPGCLVMHYDMLNQVGTRVTNYVAVIEWKGKTNSIVLESNPDSKQEPIARSVVDDLNDWKRPSGFQLN